MRILILLTLMIFFLTWYNVPERPEEPDYRRYEVMTGILDISVLTKYPAKYAWTRGIRE